MQLQKTFQGQWNAWSLSSKNRNVTIELDSPKFEDGGKTAAYFTLIIKGDEYPFYIQLDRAGYPSGEFGANLSNDCTNKRQCIWNSTMEDYVDSTEYSDLKTLLDTAVNIALQLDKIEASSGTTVPARRKLRSDVDELFSFIRTRPYGMIIVPHTKTKWTITTLKDITCSLVIKQSGLSIYGDVSVIMPRLKIGRNVDFGGNVTYAGLVDKKPVKKYTDIVASIHAALENEQPYMMDIPYNSVERNICKGTHTRTNKVATVVTLFVDSSLDDDHIGVPTSMYDAEMKKTNSVDYIYAEVSSDLGLTGWYVAEPMDYKIGTVGVSQLAFTNLNMTTTKGVGAISFGTLTTPASITVRPRPESPQEAHISTDRFKEVLSQYTVLTGGHIYSIKAEYDFYIDIISIKPEMKACVFRSLYGEELDVDIIIDYDLFPEHAGGIDPLAIEDESDNEESSD